ncbi:THO complex subunit 2 isoform X3 [Nematostella vectensis]|uniref:THO complex subunit 2 isoform X3 n=1 Tax=Nematostella vectensis TaxID=45351 RepID=UPI00207706CA|nr:THO complex subunit 2 isoform X3 [Nematostella vectensis]
MADVVVPLSFIKNWEKSGKDEVLRLFKSCSKDRDGKLSDSNFLCGETDLKRVVYELFWHVIRGDLRQEDALLVMQEVADIHRNSVSMLADLICIMDVESQCLEEKERRERFLSLVAASVCIIPVVLLKERLDMETLDAVGLIQSQKAFNQKYVKTKTKLFYKQQKYNLTREESEGYAKLVVELSSEPGIQLKCDTLLENIKSLIGRFHLDPNRVLDIILEAFECNLGQQDFFLQFLQLYMSRSETASLCHILGFKYQFYKDQPGVRTPQSLFHLTALLIKSGLIHLDNLYRYLSPSDGEIKEMHTRMALEAKQEAQKMNVTVLADVSANNDENKEKDVPKEPEKPDLPPDNQKFGLCEALLMVGGWSDAKCIMNKLPTHATVAHLPIAHALCKLVHSTIEPLYRSHASKAARGRPYRAVSGGPSQAHSFDDLSKELFPMVTRLGPYLSCDPILLAKILRVGKGFLKENPMVFDGASTSSEEVQSVWCGFLTLLDEVLLPSISLLECNSSLSEELWNMLKCYPYQIRYRLYGQWKNKSYNSNMELIKVKAATIKRAKYITKRLTKENVKPSGRQIGKISHSNPGVVFEYLLTQIQKYDNFIVPVVDSLKYLTPLAYDVLAFCIIEALANPERERMKQEDTNISDWLKSLATFCGTAFRKYPIDLTGLLQYVGNQLKSGKSFDLLVLKEVVQRMSGIEMSEEVTMQQLEALCGGELLKAEGGYFGQIRNTKKSSQRLRDTLVESQLDLPLCILMAQQRNGIVFYEDDKRHLKLVGKLYDQCQDTLVQFGGFLASQFTAEEYHAHIPSLSTLGQSYHLTPDVAFYLSRPMFTHQIETKFKTERGDKELTQKQIYQCYIDAVNLVMEPVVQSARMLQTPKVWNNISPQLYVTFWSLSMYDVHVPVDRYELEIQRFKQQIVQLEENKDLAASKKKKDKERWAQLIDKLKDEQRRQEEHNQCVMSWLKHERDSWFPSKSTKSETITQFLQLCMFPRCVFTASDAIYCAKFVHMLHNLKTPNFSTLLCFDRVFSDISYTVASCTENEASRYGRFLCSMLEIVMRWHGDRKTYDKECGSYPGFVTVLRATNTDKADHLDYENFRHVCHKWQYKLTKALVVCLESKDYTQIRNTIMVLTKILPFYPKVLNLGQALERRIDKICEEEKDKRPDIFALAMGYSGQLKTKKRDMVVESEFHHKEKLVPPPSNTPSQNDTNPAVKQEKPDSQTTTAGSTAPEPAKTIKTETVDSTASTKSKSTVNVKKEESVKSTSPSTTKADSDKPASKPSGSSSSARPSGTSTPTNRQNAADSPSRGTGSSSTKSSGNSSSKTQSTSNRVVKTTGSTTPIAKADTTGSESEGKRGESVGKTKSKDKDKESREKDKEKKEERDLDKNSSERKEKHERDKEAKTKERSISKERDKSKGEKTKEKSSSNHSKHKSTPSLDTSKDGEVEKEAKRRKLDATPTHQESQERRSKSLEREKEKDKDKERALKAERKRASLDTLENKETKRRKEDIDTVTKTNTEGKVKTKTEDGVQKEKTKVKLIRTVKDESVVKEKKEKSSSKKVSEKEARHDPKEAETKEDEKSRRHHRSSSRRT